MSDHTTERARINSILASEHAGKLPTLAQAIAFQTNLDSDVAAGILAAAHADLKAAGPSPTAPIHRRTNQQPQPGFGSPDTTETRPGRASTSASWGKAVASANRQAG